MCRQILQHHCVQINLALWCADKWFSTISSYFHICKINKSSCNGNSSLDFNNNVIACIKKKKVIQWSLKITFISNLSVNIWNIFYTQSYLMCKVFISLCYTNIIQMWSVLLAWCQRVCFWKSSLWEVNKLFLYKILLLACQIKASVHVTFWKVHFLNSFKHF